MFMTATTQQSVVSGRYKAFMMSLLFGDLDDLAVG